MSVDHEYAITQVDNLMEWLKEHGYFLMGNDYGDVILFGPEDGWIADWEFGNES